MMTTLSVLAALAVVMVIVIPPFPLFPAFDALRVDFMDIPFLLAGFIYGPLAGLAIVVIGSVIQGLTVSVEGGIYGIIMHIIASGTLVVVSSIIYRRKHTRKGAIIGLAAGVLSMTAIMIPANLLVTPAYTGLPVEAIAGWLLPFIIPFNLIKAGVNALIAFIIYKPLRRLILKLSKRQTNEADNKK